MGLISSLNNAMAGTNARAGDIGRSGVGKADMPALVRPLPKGSDGKAMAAAQAREAWFDRTLDASALSYYTRRVSDAAASEAQTGFLGRLQALFSTGEAGALDTGHARLQQAVEALAASPDDTAAQSRLAGEAQNMVQALRRLSINLDDIAQQATGQIAASAEALNGALKTLASVNTRLQDIGAGPGRAGAIEQRDRLVTSIAELVDIKASYRADGTVALTTGSRLGLLGGGIAQFSVEKGGALLLTTSSGSRLELTQKGVLTGGAVGGLLALRDEVLVGAKAELDGIAAGLALGFSAVETPGTPVENGFDIALSGMRKGNEIIFAYADYGVVENIRIVDTNQPLDHVEAGGERVLGADLSDPVGAARTLAELLPRLTIAATAVGDLRILGDANVLVQSAVVRTTADGSLFTDGAGGVFTNDPDTVPPQKAGFAARIAVNGAAASRLDAVRGDRLDGLGEVISQAIANQSDVVATALRRHDDRLMALEAVRAHLDTPQQTGVKGEMTRLFDLETMFAANVRTVVIFKEMLDSL
jgi:flagellar hook-associated protein 1